MSEGVFALIVVDMQIGLDDPQYGERCNPNCETNIRRLLGAWRKAGQPVFFTQHISLRPGSPLARGGAGTSIKQEVAPVEGEAVFQKSVNSALKDPLLLRELQIANPSSVVVVGMATDTCVTATAREAKDLGYVTVVVGEACATFARTTPEGDSYSAATVQGVSLAALAASGIYIRTASKAIEQATR